MWKVQKPLAPCTGSCVATCYKCPSLQVESHCLAVSVIQITLNSTQLRKMKILQAVLAVFVFLAISSSLARSLAGTEGDKFDTHSTTMGETVLGDSQDVPRATPWPHMAKAWLDMKMIDWANRGHENLVILYTYYILSIFVVVRSSLISEWLYLVCFMPYY